MLARPIATPTSIAAATAISSVESWREQSRQRSDRSGQRLGGGSWRIWFQPPHERQPPPRLPLPPRNTLNGRNPRDSDIPHWPLSHELFEEFEEFEPSRIVGEFACVGAIWIEHPFGPQTRTCR